MKEEKKERVVVGLSGGVDSAVAAYLCMKEGYEVIALFMKNWHDEGVTISKECPWLEDSQDALQVAEKLGIPFQTIDLSKEYKESIVDYMFSEYESGRTPNPDVLCNREIKFDVFLKKALELNADYVATGHYCRKEQIVVDGKVVYRLIAGKDSGKDQSYFLCQLSQEQLSKALFPVGNLQKSEVREIARELDLSVAEKKDSQGLCFIGKVSLPEFLQQELGPKQGDILELPSDNTNGKYASIFHAPLLRRGDGIKIGEHFGAHYFTIGQRKGLGIGGSPVPRYVVSTDTKENLVYVAAGDEHPALYRKGLFVRSKNVHWIREDKMLMSHKKAKYKARIRYRQPLQTCTLEKQEEGLYILFDEPQRAVAQGQFVAWYDGDELIGSGVIN